MESRQTALNFNDVRRSERRRSNPTKSDDPKWRDKLAFWVIGLNTQTGYIVVLTAAKDIIHAVFPEAKYVENPRHCCVWTTGLILLLVTVPAFSVQFLKILLRKYFLISILLSMLLSIVGYIVLAFTSLRLLSLSGIILISLGYGISEFQFSELSWQYEVKISRCFRYGTSNSLIVGSFSYTTVVSCGASMFKFFLCMPILPVVATLCYLCLLSPPQIINKREDSEFSLSMFNSEPKLTSFDDKLFYIIRLIKYFIAYGIMVFFDGVINQGLYEFIYWYGNFLNLFAQYRVYICLYNLGFYACLTTRNLLLVRYVWTSSILHIIIASFFACEAVLFMGNYFWGVLLLAYLQGINAGVAYTSIRDRILTKEPSTYINMAEKTLKNLILIMLILSGVFNFGVHYYLSRTPEPKRY